MTYKNAKGIAKSMHKNGVSDMDIAKAMKAVIPKDSNVSGMVKVSVLIKDGMLVQV